MQPTGTQYAKQSRRKGRAIVTMRPPSRGIRECWSDTTADVEQDWFRQNLPAANTHSLMNRRALSVCVIPSVLLQLSATFLHALL